ncbi:uncharacterized protein LOC143366383 [Andrena cerasifolii]|uniref:uncharacterized protein LOC143366383 n=1 Tax=Andrena cerasifolii TaxID=2819439 RepID=UPI004037B70E
MASSVQGQEPVDSERPGKPLNLRPYPSKRNFCVNVNKTRLNGNGNLEELACKPVSVSITKLSVSDLKKMAPRRLRKSTIAQRSAQMKKDLRKRRKEVERRVNERDVQRQIVTRKEQMPSDSKEDIRNCTNINQPCIKLRRIDEVINKIAQTFARVIPNKDPKTDILPQYVEKSNAESSDIVSPLLPLSINENECHGEAESLTTDCRVNENSQARQPARSSRDRSSCNDELHVNNKRKNFERLIQVISDFESYDGSNASDKSQEIFLREAKRFKLDSTAETTQISVTNEELCTRNNLEESINTKRNTEESLSQMELAGKVNGSDESCELSKEQNSEAADRCTDVAKQNSDISGNESRKLDLAVEGIKEECASTCVPSGTDFIHTSESNACSEDNGSAAVEEPMPETNGSATAEEPMPETNDSATVEEPMPETNELREAKHKTLISDPDLMKEYKLFRELRVLLIKLDSIKASSGNKYSAAEIKQLTDNYVDSILESNYLHTPHDLSINAVQLERSTEPVGSLNTCENDGSNTRAPIKSVQNISEESSSILDRSLSPSAMEQMKIHERKRSQKQYVTKSLTEFVENNSLKEMHIDAVSEKSKSSSAVIVPFSSKKSTANGPDGLSGTGTTGSARKLKIISCSNVKIKSIGGVLNSRETISKYLFRNENSEKTGTDAVPPGNAETDKRKKFVSTILALKSNLKDEMIQGSPGKKIRLIKLHAKLHHKADGRKNTVSTSISPMKHNAYKCIVCNLCFEDYSSLQQHLTTHTQKQNSASPEKNPGKQQDTSSSLEANTSQLDTIEEKLSKLDDIEEKPSKLDDIEEKPSKPRSNKKNKESPQKELRKNPEEAKSSPSSKKRHNFPRKRSKASRALNEISNCSICSQAFPTDVELAAHIYLHTESELQRAYQIAKKKKEVDVQTGGEKSEHAATKESVTKKANKNAGETTDIVEKLVTVNGEVEAHVSELLEQNLVNSKIRISREATITDPLITNKPSASNQSESRMTPVPSVQNSMEKEKINKTASIKRGFTICQCHNKSENSENCLQIEIVLLCHSCRVLFRSMECFETHYRLPDSTLCNQNRLESGRSPNLFCATCGMIFSSVQDVRHHLQMHARFKQSCTMDFRCNICKVIFIGIGSLFYIHWSKHSKDPFWMASEQSFPKMSVINSKAKKVENKPGSPELNNCIETYIQVAEHICWKCKLPFVTEDDLKKHESKCNVTNSTEDTAVERTVASNAAVQKQPTIQLICSACDGTFSEKVEFYTHMRSEHNFVCEPQFVCVSLTTIKRAFICSICMDISDGIDQFEEHWVKHNTKRLFFTCTCCEKSCSSLKTLLEHVREHESITGEDTLSCKVNYQQVEYICLPCNIGFHSQTSFEEHAVIHKLRVQTLKRKSNKESDQKSSTPTSLANDDSSSSTSKEKEISVQREVNAKSQTIRNKAGEYSTTSSSTQFDREKLINILEGNDDESESELTIDLTELAEERKELQGRDKNKEKQSASTSKLNETSALLKNATVQTPSQNVISAVSNGVTQASESVTIPAPSKNTSTSTPENLNPSLKTPVTDGHVSCEPASDSSNTQSIVSASKEEPPVSKRASSIKPRQGFLRVKTLAELVGNKDTQELSKAYGCTFEGPNVWRLNKDTGQREIPATKTPSQQPSNSASETGNPAVRSAPAERPSQQSPRLPWNISNQLLASSNALLHEKMSATKHLQSSMPQKRNFGSSAQSSTSAYHKNLPACNIVRTNIAIPRSALRRIGKTPAKSGSNSPSVQNVQEARPATCSANESSAAPTVGSVADSNATTSLNPSSHTETAVDSNRKYTCGTYRGHRGENVAGYSMQEISNIYSIYKKQSIEQSARESGNNAGDATATAKDNLTTNDQNCKESTQATPNESGAKQASSGVFYQYPALPPSSLSNNNQWPMQSQQMNQPVARSTPPSFYYKNPSAGGMSIVINQTTPAVQNIPTIGILPQQAPQPQMYQPLLYSNPATNVNPYVQQLQNDASGYQVAPNPYDASVGGTIMTYAVTLQPPSQPICPYCPKTVSFMSEELLQLHIDSNHVFDCNICSQRFCTFTDMTIHRLKHRIM